MNFRPLDESCVDVICSAIRPLFRVKFLRWIATADVPPKFALLREPNIWLCQLVSFSAFHFQSTVTTPVENLLISFSKDWRSPSRQQRIRTPGNNRSSSLVILFPCTVAFSVSSTNQTRIDANYYRRRLINTTCCQAQTPLSIRTSNNPCQRNRPI